MAAALRSLLFFVSLPWLWATDYLDLDCDAEPAQVNLLQAQMSTASRQRGKNQGSAHFWPHSRGRLGKYNLAYDMPESLNLTAAHAWTWEHPFGLSSLIWSSLIDSNKSIYVCDVLSTHKLSPDGKLLWSSLHGGENCVLDGSALYGMHQNTAVMFALDLDTGKPIWTRKVATSTGQNGDMVEAHNGVLVAGVGAFKTEGDGGQASSYVIGVDASNGDELWSFKPECPLWNAMALFPDEDTLNIMDCCGGAYRLGLYNGSVIWGQGSPDSFTDGGAILDAAGDMYTCSSPAGNRGTSGNGVVRKYQKSNGEKLWEVTVDSPCVNFPAVSADGSTLILAPGGLATDAETKKLNEFETRQEKEDFYNLQQELLENGTQRSYYGLPDLQGSIIGLDAHSGKLIWRHDVEPWPGVAFALDEKRGYNYLTGKALMPHCWPSHWSAAITDTQGRVYIGRSTGDVYVYDPRTGAQDKFHTGDGILMGGMTAAPGMLVASTCSFVHVFKF